MVKISQLSKAPIVEALIDFRVEIDSEQSVNQLVQAIDEARFGYIRKGRIVEGTFGFSLNPNVEEPASSKTEARFLGLRLESSDGKYVAQFSVKGFTLSRLDPYESWENLRAEAGRLWPYFVEHTRAQRIVRTATRFINNLRLPLDKGGSLEDFLTAAPRLPSELPQGMHSFFQRCLVRDTGADAMIAFTQLFEPQKSDGPAPVILDIDAFVMATVQVDSSEAWDYLEKLRELKNRFFFGALTEAAVELYK